MHRYEPKLKARNRGDWTIPRAWRIAQRKSVRRHFAQWERQARRPDLRAACKTPPPSPSQLPAVFQKHIESWSA